MKYVGIFEAKTHLSSLIDEVEKGGEVTITRHGKAVAKLVPNAEIPELNVPELTPELIERRREAIKKLKEIASKLQINATHEEIKAWIAEGRH